MRRDCGATLLPRWWRACSWRTFASASAISWRSSLCVGGEAVACRGPRPLHPAYCCAMLCCMRQHAADHIPFTTETSGRCSTAASARRPKTSSHSPASVVVAIRHPAAVVESKTDCGAPGRSQVPKLKISLRLKEMGGMRNSLWSARDSLRILCCETARNCAR
eukprot:8244204-Pyramimonas_sp.AAC.1